MQEDFFEGATRIKPIAKANATKEVRVIWTERGFRSVLKDDVNSNLIRPKETLIPIVYVV